jgi:hypothetical protein
VWHFRWDCAVRGLTQRRFFAERLVRPEARGMEPCVEQKFLLRFPFAGVLEQTPWEERQNVSGLLKPKPIPSTSPFSLTFETYGSLPTRGAFERSRIPRTRPSHWPDSGRRKQRREPIIPLVSPSARPLF